MAPHPQPRRRRVAHLVQTHPQARSQLADVHFHPPDAGNVLADRPRWRIARALARGGRRSSGGLRAAVQERRRHLLDFLRSVQHPSLGLVRRDRGLVPRDARRRGRVVLARHRCARRCYFTIVER
eukprot:31549-Pelagococcus_subviridis.AAC.2